MTRLGFLEFSTDQRGAVRCNNYIGEEKSERILSMFSDSNFGITGTRRAYSCLTCRFLKYDECYFNSREIRDIKSRIVSFSMDPYSKHHEYKCSICGYRISQLLTVIKKEYIKRRNGVEIPLICRSCYRYIAEYGNIKRKILRNFLFFFLMGIIPTLISLLTVLLLFYFSPSEDILFTLVIVSIVLTICMSYLVYYAYRRIKVLVNGNKISRSFLSDPELRDLTFR